MTFFKNQLQLLRSEKQILSKKSCMWALGPKPFSQKWNRVIDWYLHFQISAFELKTSYKKPLLIKSSTYLPAEMVLVLDFHPRWLNSLYSIWYRLKKPALRIFLPSPLKEADLQRVFKDKTIPIQWVRD